MSVLSQICGLSTKTKPYRDLEGNRQDAETIVPRDGLPKEVVAWHINALLRTWLLAVQSCPDASVLRPTIQDNGWLPGASITYYGPNGFWQDGLFAMEVEIIRDDGRQSILSLFVALERFYNLNAGMNNFAASIASQYGAAAKFIPTITFNLVWFADFCKLTGKGTRLLNVTPGRMIGARICGNTTMEILNCLPHRALLEAI